jgi:Cu(I)-responsive transcriptional regulator
MNIGEAAQESGVSAKAIRYYESVGLIPRALRNQSGYRHYGDTEVHTLRFIRRARNLGFSVEETDALLALWRNRRRSSALVKALALKHVAALDAKAAELMAMSRTLKHLADHCSGDDRPECPILDDIAASRPQAAPSAAPLSQAHGRKFR